MAAKDIQFCEFCVRFKCECGEEHHDIGLDDYVTCGCGKMYDVVVTLDVTEREPEA